MKRTAVLLLGMILVGSIPTIVQSAEVTILNSGFEQPALEDGTWITGGENWTFGIYYVDEPGEWIEGGDGNEVDGGVWNPDASVGFTDGAFAGDNSGWATSRFDVDAGLAQVLDHSLQANTEYVLGVQVGNALYNEGDITAEFRLELLAGGVMLESMTGDPPASDAWAYHTMMYESGPNPAQAGEPLEIRLIAAAYIDGGGIDGYEVDFDEVTLTALSPGPLGDFNRNGILDAEDVDLLSNEVRAGTNNQDFDLNGDEQVDDVDRDIWVEDSTIAFSYYGDANLDREFNSSDFVAVFQKGLFETQQPAGWAEGDWNGDAIFGSGDFVLAFQRGGYEAGPRSAVASVPEPSSLVLLLFGIGLAMRSRRSFAATTRP